MTTSETQALITTYLADETKLYQDWFQTMNAQNGEYVVEFVEFPSLDSLKQRFEDWFQSQRQTLKRKICEEWGYQEKKKTFEDREALIIAISADCLVVIFGVPTTNVLTIGAILVINGYLERLCSQ